jgi:hypothetical protein
MWMKGKNPMDVTIKCEIVAIHKMWCPSLFATFKVKVQAQKLCSNVAMHLCKTILTTRKKTSTSNLTQLT